MPDLENFRRETRAWLEANCPPEMRKPHDLGGRHVLGRPQRQVLLRGAARLVRADARQGLDRAALAEGIWRRRPRWRGGKDPAPGDGGDRRAAAADLVRHLHARAGASEIRHRSAEEGASAEDHARPDPLVPGLFRAERRLRPRLAADPRDRRRRRLHHQRPEDLDLLCQLRRLDLLPGAHRSCGEEARRHQLHPVRHGLEGRVDEADPADLRLLAVLRDLLRQCAGAEVACGRHRQPRLGRRQVSAAA